MTSGPPKQLNNRSRSSSNARELSDGERDAPGCPARNRPTERLEDAPTDPGQLKRGEMGPGPASMGGPMRWSAAFRGRFREGRSTPDRCSAGQPVRSILRACYFFREADLTERRSARQGFGPEPSCDRYQPGVSR